MKDKKIYIGTAILLVLILGGNIGVIASNLTHNPAKPASATGTGTYIQNSTSEEEQSNCCAN